MITRTALPQLKPPWMQHMSATTSTVPGTTCAALVTTVKLYSTLALSCTFVHYITQSLGNKIIVMPVSLLLKKQKNKFGRLLLRWVNFENIDAPTSYVTTMGDNQAPKRRNDTFLQKAVRKKFLVGDRQWKAILFFRSGRTVAVSRGLGSPESDG